MIQKRMFMASFARPLRRGLLFSRSFRHRFHLRQALLKVVTDHFVHVHEHRESLGHKILVSGHGPLNAGLIALRREREIGGNVVLR